MPSRNVVFLLCLLNGAASGATYRASAQLTPAPADRQHCLKIRDQGVTDCGVVDQVRAAFSSRVATMFTAGGTPNLQFVLTVTDADIVEQVSGWFRFFELRTSTRVLSAEGTLIDEIDSPGRATVTQETPLARAVEIAAGAAAAEFEERLFNSPKMRDYVIANRVASTSDLALPARTDKLLWLGLGGALVQGGGDGDAGFAPNFRFAMSMRWLVLQLTYAHFSASFQGTRQYLVFDSSMNTNDLGLEAGAVLHLGPNVEVRAGPGVHYLFASAEGGGGYSISASGNTSASGSKLTPTAFVSLSRSLFPRRNGTRLVVGIEGRGYLATRVDLREFNRGVPVANSTFGIFLGGEFPWGSSGASR